MRIALPVTGRLVLAGWFGLVALGAGMTAQAATPAEKSLPDTTLLFIKVANAANLREAFAQSQTGQLINDPAMKPLRDDVMEKLADFSKSIKDEVGLSLGELVTLPQGPVTISVVAKSEAKIPAALLITADAGKNSSKMAEVMNKATKLAENDKSKVSTETFKDLTLHIIQAPKQGDYEPPPLVWTTVGSIYHIATDIDAIKDLISHADGRDDSLASNESFSAVAKRVGGSEAGVLWFLDIAKSIKLGLAASGNAQQAEAILQLTGINGLKAVGGSYNLNTGPYDSVSKTFFLAPAPAQGVLKIFQMPKVNLRPQPWVPATIASYQSLSWDLDGAYKAIEDLINMFQPGALGAIEQQLVPPGGGEPLSLQKDIFGPVGDRISIIADYKKPIKEDSQRVLAAVALEDVKAFQNTLTKLIALSGSAPEKRDFQGTTIYDFKLPEMPNQQANSPLKGKISLAIAKDSLLVATDPSLLELILRGGGAPLADSAAFQQSTKDVPAQTSTLTYVNPDEAARQSYDTLKSGQFEKALEPAAAMNPAFAQLAKLIDKDKLPEYSVFAKYISQGGGFGTQEEDGAIFTQYTLRKSNP